MGAAVSRELLHKIFHAHAALAERLNDFCGLRFNGVNVFAGETGLPIQNTVSVPLTTTSASSSVKT